MEVAYTYEADFPQQRLTMQGIDIGISLSPSFGIGLPFFFIPAMNASPLHVFEHISLNFEILCPSACC